MFPHRIFGRIEEDELFETGRLGLMCREQGLRITSDLSRMTLPSERHVDYAKMARSMSSSEIREDLLDDENAYTAIVQDLSLTLHDYVNVGDRRNELRKFFLPPGVFDGIINILVQQLLKKPIRPHICDEQARKALVKQLCDKIVEEVTKDREPRTFAQVCEVLPQIALDLPKKNLSAPFVDLQGQENIRYKLYMQGYQKFCKHHWRPVDIRRTTNDGYKGANTGVLFHGEQGCGKSQILSYLTTWAHDHGASWCSLAITDHEEFVNASTDIFRM